MLLRSFGYFSINFIILQTYVLPIVPIYSSWTRFRWDEGVVYRPSWVCDVTNTLPGERLLRCVAITWGGWRWSSQAVGQTKLAALRCCQLCRITWIACLVIWQQRTAAALPISPIRQAWSAAFVLNVATLQLIYTYINVPDFGDFVFISSINIIRPTSHNIVQNVILKEIIFICFKSLLL